MTTDFIEVWRLLTQYPALRRREALNLVLMKWLMEHKGQYDEQTIQPDYAPSFEIYPTLSPSFEFRGLVAETAHS